MDELTLPEADMTLLRRAGSLLDTVGRHSPAGTPGSIECLTSADHLSELGLTFTAMPMPVPGGDARAAIRESLQILGKLSGSTFALPDVVAATDAAQRAYIASSRA